MAGPPQPVRNETPSFHFTKGLQSEYGNVMIVSLSLSAAFAAASAS